MKWPIVIGLIGGSLGAGAVIAGAVLDWPGFGIRSGYWGTHFLDSFLYAMGSDRGAVAIVACVWFIYGFLLLALIGMAIPVKGSGRRP